MKSKVLKSILVLCLLVVGIGNAWGEEKMFTFSHTESSGAVRYYDENNQSLGGIKLTYNEDNASTYALYSIFLPTPSATVLYYYIQLEQINSGYAENVITKVELIASSADDQKDNIQVVAGSCPTSTLVKNEEVATWQGLTAGWIKFQNQTKGAKGGAQITTIKVYYDELKNLGTPAIAEGKSYKNEYKEGDKFDPSDLVIAIAGQEISYSGNEDKFQFTPSLETGLSSGLTQIDAKVCGASFTIPVTVDAYWHRTVHFYDKGEKLEDKTAQVAENDNPNTFTFPTLEGAPEGYVFSGWSSTQTYNGVPTSLIAAGTTRTPERDEDYYAVYGLNGQVAYEPSNNTEKKLDGVLDKGKLDAGSSYNVELGSGCYVKSVKFEITNTTGALGIYGNYSGTVVLCDSEGNEIEETLKTINGKSYEVSVPEGLDLNSFFIKVGSEARLNDIVVTYYQYKTEVVDYTTFQHEVTISSSVGYATYVTKYAMDFSGQSDIEALGVVPDPQNEVVRFVALSMVPANTAIVVRGKTGIVSQATTSVDALTAEQNSFTYSKTALNGASIDNCSIYYLGVSDGEVVFKKLGATGSLAAGKGYFTVSNSGAALFRLATENETSIESVSNFEESESIYSISGQKLDKIGARGLYIVNGKKILVK